MAKFRALKNSLIAGQISPNAMGRTDLPQYPHACRDLKNMIPLVSGGAYRRPGTFFDHSYDASVYTAPRLIPFVVSQAEAYNLVLAYEFGVAPYFGAYRTTDCTSTATASTITGSHNYGAINDGLDANDRYDWESSQYAQSVDVMTLVHPLYKPLRVSRTAQDAFTVRDFDFGLTGANLRDAYPYRRQNTSAITLSINTASVGFLRTVTASAAFFNAAHVGALFKLDSNGTGTIGAFKVTAYISPTQVTVEVIVAIDSTAASLLWWESAWSDYRGWPRAIGFYQQRIVYGGNATDRDSLWFSQTANYDVMSVETIVDPLTSPTSTQPFTFTISSQELNHIQWLAIDSAILVGTLGNEIIVEPISATAGIACANTKATPKSGYGSTYRQAVRIGEELIFCMPAGDEVKSLVFSNDQQSYVAEPVQLLFDNYPKPEYLLKRRHYRTFAWDESRKTLWCVDTAGNLFGMTRDRRLGVTAWHTHQMGGFDADQIESTTTGYPGYSQLCAGSVISVAVVPNPQLGVNDIWLAVRRFVDGGYAYHIERFMGKGIASDTVVNAWLGFSGNYMTDASVHVENAFYLGIPETHSFNSGFDHLEGETLTGIASAFTADDSQTGEQGIVKLRDTVVTAGVVTLVAPYPSSYATVPFELHFGLPFNSIVAPVRLEAGSQIGSSQSAIKRIHKLTVRFTKTLSAKVGATAELLETLIFREASTPMGNGTELFTGDKVIPFEGDYDREGYVYLLQDQPFPFAVTAIIAEGQTYD